MFVLIKTKYFPQILYQPGQRINVFTSVVDLPWVESADHLRQLVSQVSNMEKNCQRARFMFFRKSLEIREHFKC